MALEGTLRDFSLSDIFQLISLQRKTGILTLKSKNDTVTISFLDGKVVNADSEIRGLENQLGNVLLKRGTISEQKLNEALKLQQETLQRLGYLLIKEGIITRDELREALTQQILEIIYKVFRWQDGEYHFSQETTIEFDREAIIPLTAENILMEGAQMMDEWPLIEAKITSSDMIFVQKEINQEVAVSSGDDEGDFDFQFSDEPEEDKPSDEDVIKLSKNIFDIYHMLNGQKKVSDVVEISRLNEFETYKAIYDLLTRGLIEVAVIDKPDVAEESTIPEPVEVTPEKKNVMVPIILLGIVVAIGIFFRPFNPMNGWASFIKKQNVIDENLYIVSMARVFSLERVMRIYGVATLKYPENLEELVEIRLATTGMLVDPWLKSYAYMHQDDNYYLYGYGPDGKRSLEMLISHADFEGQGSDAALEKPAPTIEILD